MDDTTLDAIEGQARFSALTGDGVAPARSVIALVAEVRRLTAEAATQREWFEAADAAAERRLDQSIAWMERAEAAEAEVVTLRARLAAAHEASDTIERELICCDTYRMDDSPRPGHQICYWSAAAKAVLAAALATSGEGE